MELPGPCSPGLLRVLLRDLRCGWVITSELILLTDHFFTSCRITEILVIGPAHLQSFLANVSATQSLVDGDAGAKGSPARGGASGVTVET